MEDRYVAVLLEDIRGQFKAFGERLDGMQQRIDERFDGVDQRFDGIDKRLDGVDKRLDGVDKRLDGVDKRLDRLGTDVKDVKKRLGRVEKIVLNGAKAR